MPDFNIQDLETHGFVVIKNFLSNNEIQQRLSDYQQSRDGAQGVVAIKNYTLLKSGLHGLESKIESILHHIVKSTNIQVNLIGPNGIYFDTKLAKLEWHQDHESYYVWQTGYHQINFWMPLIKSDQNTAGLRVVPMNILQSQIGSLFDQHIVNQGAKRFVPSGSVTHVYDDELGIEYDLPVNINDIAQCPALMPGDVLLLRGDMIHATQESDTQRVSLAVRAVNGMHRVHRQQFFDQCAMKKFVLGANHYGTKKIIDYFASGADQFAIQDLFKGGVQTEHIE